jgi:metal-responsive CopG/Arc/MetJ family transcriptional regulator
MSIQIAVRLPDDLVAEVDAIVRTGQESSRASIVEAALRHELRRRTWAREVEILADSGADYDDLEGMREFARRTSDPLD